MEKAKRYFVRTTNTSVAAGATETIFSKSFKGILKQMFIRMNGDDTTGTNASVLKVKVDGETILNHSLSGLYTEFCYGESDAAIVRKISWSNTEKVYALLITFDTYVNNNILITFENKDTSNACLINSGLIYDKYV